MIIDAFAGNFLILRQDVNSSIKGQSVVSRIPFQSIVRGNIILQSVGNSLVFRGIATVDRKITVVSLGDTLNLSSTPTRGPEVQSVVSTFFFLGQITNTGFYSVDSSLELLHGVSVVSGPWSENVIELSQTLSVKQVKVLTLTSTLDFSSHQAVFIPNVCVSMDQDSILHNPQPYFEYGTRRITLPSPQFGNTEKVSQNRIMRRSRAGDLIIFRDSIWPASEVLHMDFAYLKPDIAHQLLEFMRDTMGFKVTFFDNEQRTWFGYILSPASQISEQIRNNYTVTIEFQGNQKPLFVESKSQVLTLTQTVQGVL